jgi:hypothetical protein
MPVNQFEELLKEKLSSFMFELQNKDRNQAYSNQNLMISYDHVDSMIHFYLEKTNTTPQEMVNLISDGFSSVPALLYYKSHSRIIQRPEWIKIFTPVLEEDIAFYGKCLHECLKTHVSYGDKEEPLQKINEQDFLDLLDIGERSGHLKSLTPNDFITANPVYQQHLSNRNLSFEEIDFSTLINHLDSLNQNQNNHKKVKEHNQLMFMTNYCSKILDLYEDKPGFFAHLRKKGMLVTFAEDFLSKGYQVNEKNQSRLDKFVFDLISEPEIKKELIGNGKEYNHYHVARLFESYHSLVIPFLDSLNQTERQIMFENPSNINKAYFNYKPDLGSWFENLSTTNIAGVGKVRIKWDKEVLDYLITMVRANNPDVEAREKFIGNNLLKLAEMDKVVPVAGNAIYQVIENNAMSLPYLFDMKEESIKNLQKFIDLKELGKFDENIVKKVFSKVSSNMKNDIYRAYFAQHDEELGQKHWNYVNYIKSNLANYIKLIGNYDVLDAMIENPEKPFWASLTQHIQTTVKVKSNKGMESKKVTLHDYPFFFQMLEDVGMPIMDWFLKPDNAPHLKDISYKGKGLISYMINVKKSKSFIQYLPELLQKPLAYEVFLEKNKAALTAIQKIEIPEIKTALNYYTLDKKINTGLNNSIDDEVENSAPKFKI